MIRQASKFLCLVTLLALSSLAAACDGGGGELVVDVQWDESWGTCR